MKYSGKVKTILIETINRLSADPTKYAVNPHDPDTFFEPTGKSTRGFNQIHVKELDMHVDRILTRSQSKKKHSRPESVKKYRPMCRSVAMDYRHEPFSTIFPLKFQQMLKWENVTGSILTGLIFPRHLKSAGTF